MHLFSLFLENTKVYDFIRLNINQKAYVDVLEEFIYLF